MMSLASTLFRSKIEASEKANIKLASNLTALD